MSTSARTIPSAAVALERVTQCAARAAQITRQAYGLKPGQYARQGDVYFIPATETGGVTLRFADREEQVNVKDFTVPVTRRQLVAGDSTGSHHVAEGPCTIHGLAQPHPLIAACIHVMRRGDVTITHPTHGHIQLDAGYWIVTQQRDVAAEELRAVKD